MHALSANVARFCSLLRNEHAFAIGHAETHAALRAVEAVGVEDARRFRAALRLVCCGSYEEVAVFERAFDTFFARERGVSQAAYRPRHTRAAEPGSSAEPRSRGAQQRTKSAPDGEARDGSDAAAERRSTDEDAGGAAQWQALRARYSPAAARAGPPEVGERDLVQMLAAASAMLTSVRLGPARRWKPLPHGGRLDVRRTVRASLQTGGDAVVLRTLGHPPRKPRFVVLIDGSRSMTEMEPILQFARALALRSARTSVFFFSTALRDVTRALRELARSGGRLLDVGEAWGGGTRIGAALGTFVAEYGRRLLTRETIVIIYSDGLDVGDPGRLEGALRAIDRRTAGLVWLNPHAARPGFTPASRAMRAALPFLSLLAAADDPPGFLALARRLAREPRLRGRRG